VVGILKGGKPGPVVAYEQIWMPVSEQWLHLPQKLLVNIMELMA
jgi:hypothetical protein